MDGSVLLDGVALSAGGGDGDRPRRRGGGHRSRGARADAGIGGAGGARRRGRHPVYGVTTGLGPSRGGAASTATQARGVLAADAARPRDGGGRALPARARRGPRWRCAATGSAPAARGRRPARRRRAGGAAQRRRAPVHPAQRLGGSVGPVPAGPRRADPDRRGRGRARRGADGVGATRWPSGLRAGARSVPRTGWRSARAPRCRPAWPRWPWSTPRRCLEALQVAAALSMEGFRANLSPLDPRVVAARPAPGQAWAAAGCARCWRAARSPSRAPRAGSRTRSACAASARSTGRCTSRSSCWRAAVAPELGGAADNPLVLTDDEEILSTGNFHVPALAMALDATAIALAQVAATSAERQARLKTERLSGAARRPRAPTGRAQLRAEPAEQDRPGAHGGDPPPGGAAVDHADDRRRLRGGRLHRAPPTPRCALREQIERLRLLVAIELIVAAQAVDLAVDGRGRVAGRGHRRGLSPRCASGSRVLVEDRPLGPTSSG